MDKVAKLLKIDHVLGHAPRELSNGQKQRTALARALAAEPRILLLDDPLRNVDAKLRFEMRLELPRLLRQTGATVLYVTQDYKEAMALADRIAVIANGKFIQTATPEDIYLKPATLGVARLFGDPSINTADTKIEIAGKTVNVTLGGVKVPIDGTYTSVWQSRCDLWRASRSGRDQCIEGRRTDGQGHGGDATERAYGASAAIGRRLGIPGVAPLFRNEYSGTRCQGESHLRRIRNPSFRQDNG